MTTALTLSGHCRHCGCPPPFVTPPTWADPLCYACWRENEEIVWAWKFSDEYTWRDYLLRAWLGWPEGLDFETYKEERPYKALLLERNPQRRLLLERNPRTDPAKEEYSSVDAAKFSNNNRYVVLSFRNLTNYNFYI